MLTYTVKSWILGQKMCVPRYLLQCGSWSPWRSVCWKLGSQPTALLTYAKIFRRWDLVEWNCIVGVMASNGAWDPGPFLSLFPSSGGVSCFLHCVLFPTVYYIVIGNWAKWPWAEISDSLSQNKPSIFFKSVIKGIFVIVAERKPILRKRHCILK